MPPGPSLARSTLRQAALATSEVSPLRAEMEVASKSARVPARPPGGGGPHLQRSAPCEAAEAGITGSGPRSSFPPANHPANCVSHKGKAHRSRGAEPPRFAKSEIEAADSLVRR